MYSVLKYTVITAVAAGMMSVITNSHASSNKPLPKMHRTGINNTPVLLADTPPPEGAGDDTDKVVLPFPFKDNGYQEPVYNSKNPLTLPNPDNVKTNVEYNPTDKQFEMTQKMGNIDYRKPTYMTDEEYQDYMFKKQVKSYWKSRIQADNVNAAKSPLIPKLTVGGEMFDRIFGGNTVDIRPQGSAELIFGLVINKNQNPALPIKQRRISNFDFNMKIQLNLVGKIGEKLKLTTNYNTEASFDFENQMKIEYNGLEDEILKKIEAGNVSLPLNSSLITGSQSLFGVKTTMQFGRLTATTVLSQQRGKKTEVTVQGGSQTTPYTLNADAYEGNRHYFLSQYFRNNYNTWMSSVPIINSPLVITKIEVYITNRTQQVDQAKNIVAFADLGEDTSKVRPELTNLLTSFGGCATKPVTDLSNSIVPMNSANSLYSLVSDTFSGILKDRDFSTASSLLSNNTTLYNDCNSANKFMESGKDYEVLARARKLQPTEYTLNKRLGFISLNQALNFDEVLTVAYQYTLDGQIYQVGEFSDQFPNGDKALFLKLLKSTQLNTHIAMWDLMMKNVYSIGAYQINSQDFKLDVYRNTKGVDQMYIAHEPIDGKLLIQVLNLDRINVNGDKIPDGYFDFVPDVTINPNTGRVYFPSIEPFGNDLRNTFNSPNDHSIDDFIFQELYDSTKISAQQLTKKNVYKFKGSYKSSSSSEISLNAMNVPQGSVTVSAGGVPLTENVDYTVDYTLGRVKIINESILNSGQPIKVSSENNSLFNIQQKSLIGTRLDYKVNKDFALGGTLLHLTERPLTQKVNSGDEPVSNTIWGTDFNYRTEAPWLTRLVDKIPGINTKEMSSIQTAGEFAQLIPGHSKAIGKNGNSYLDDFEGSISMIDLRSQSTWFLASVPQGQDLFPEATLSGVQSGFNRAHMAWYTIDQSVFYQQQAGLTPDNITKTIQSNHFQRRIIETEIFPNKQPPNGQPVLLPVLDMAFYPEERGPYNFDVAPTSFSDGIDMPLSQAKGDIRLKNPQNRWGGIMRKLETNDFQTANIEFIQFWMMDPFNDDYDGTFGGAAKPTNGEMYINLGNVSEDILKDGRMSFENGLPTDVNPSLPIQQTPWGNVPSILPITNAFNINESERPYQDVGYDGLSDNDERTFFDTAYLSKIAAINSTVKDIANADPSGDDYHFYRGDDYDALKDPNGIYANTLYRYKKFNGTEGNSPTQAQYKNLNSGSYPTQASTLPNIEDINRDNTLNETEAYYQYKIRITPQDINPQNVGNNYITSAYQATVPVADGSQRTVWWYQFKVPISEGQKIGSIEGFNSIRFMRMFMKNFSAPVICRMARLELVRSDWRRYQYDLSQSGDYIANDDDQTTFDIAAVNIQENGTRTPINYVIPPGINQQQNVQTTNLVLLNEQALVLRVCGLRDGKSRAAYKNIDNDVRSFKKMKMFVHAEKFGANNLNDGDVSLFMRIGTDFTSNYYEYEVPLKLTAPGYYDPNDDAARGNVWRSDDEVVIDFEELTNLKLKRPPGSISNVEFQTDDGRIIRLVGNPSISALKGVMVGIKNPKDLGGESKCVEVWINELRLTDFNQHGGWAANARVTAKLADFGQVAVSSAMMTPFFGSIEKKISERSRETTKQYDASTTLQFGKFLPADWKINLPVYVGQSEIFITPQYDPSNPDVLMSKVNTDNFSREQVTAIKQRAQDYTRRRSLNFTNISKAKGKNATKAHIWDIENFSVTYAYTEQFKRNLTLDHNLQKTYRGALAYNYTNTPKAIKPFSKSKVKWINNKWFALIKEINFTPLPSRLGFNSDINRNYNEILSRDISSLVVVDAKTQTQYNKTFTMNRTYDMKWDITKNLKVDFTASNDGRILEPVGKIETKEQKDIILENIKKLGINTGYRQTTNVNYAIPINKIPIFDFVTATYSYKANYSFTRRPFAADLIGNNIQNGNTNSWNAQFNMTSLYNKVPFFKKVLNKAAGKPPPPPPPKDPKDSTKKKEKEHILLEHVARFIMMLKQAQLTYAVNNGTTLPGFRDSSQMLGMDVRNGTMAPGPGFVFGSQRDILSTAEQNQWIVHQHNLANPYAHTTTQTLNASAKVEPFKDLKIDLTGTRTYGENDGAFISWDSADNRYNHNTVTRTGNYSISTITIGSAFSKNQKGTNTNAVFEKFRSLRGQYQDILSQNNPYADHAVKDDGYNETQQDVILYSFMAAYTNKGVSKTKVQLFSKIPMPNWSVTYDGLGKIKLMKKYFKAITLSHAYRSTYNMGSFSNNVLYDGEKGKGFSQSRVNGAGTNFISEYQIGTVTISESFSPLIKVKLDFNKSGLSGNFEVKKERNISLIANVPQVSEMKQNEIVIGAGYRIPQLELKKIKVKGKTVKSDLNFKVDLSIKHSATVIRRVVDDVNQVTAGVNVISIKTAVDYVISQNINLRFFFDRIINKPVISTSYPTSNTNTGVSIRFNLGQ